MRIVYVKVNTYRNIDGIEVNFNPECNYIIGENNLGKSNFLSLLATIFNGKGFDEGDFFNPEKAIEIELNIKLLTSLFYLSDGDRKIESTVSSVQYIAKASINIICQIMELYKSKSTLFPDLLYTDSAG